MIRPAVHTDITPLVDLAKRAYQESAYSHLVFNEHKARRFFALSIANKQCCCFVAENDQGIVGVFVGALTDLFNGALEGKGAMDLLFYLLPEHRSMARPLINIYLAWARQNTSVVDITITNSSGIEVEQSNQFYTSIGGKRVGAMYIFDVPSRSEADNEQSS